MSVENLPVPAQIKSRRFKLRAGCAIADERRMGLSDGRRPDRNKAASLWG